MGALSSILRSVEGGRIHFRCPGCNMTHEVIVDGQPAWGWNRDVEKPTFTRSILVRGVVPITDEQHAAWMRGEPLPEPVRFVCHSFVTDGRIQFLSDCTHALTGQTVDIPPWRAE